MSYGQRYTRQNVSDYSHAFQHTPIQRSGYYPQQKPFKKHSGAKHRTYTNADGLVQYLTTGWRLTRNKELISYKAVTTKKSVLSDKHWFGSVWITLTNKVTGEVNSHWGTMQKSTGKVIISDLGVVMNPRANNGGYCGSFTK